ncbi:MAG: hypothetical protein HYZ28_20975 [Myxococcales bacterium]|nr:hypothetical protein [Myxococcales bacterium]
MRPAAETFHQRIRWRDFRGAAELIVEERRQAFESESRAKDDERNLTVTDYRLEDARVSDDGQKATVVSRISWLRLPSVSEQSEMVTSEYVFRDGAWLLERQQGGPFALAFER